MLYSALLVLGEVTMLQLVPSQIWISVWLAEPLL
jgi:hypothetical protein